jgi:hypothetical protein
MVSRKRFPLPTAVFLDGDQAESEGCHLLIGDDPPERVVFEALKRRNWMDIATRVSGPSADVIDELELAMTRSDHHEWLRPAASRLSVGGSELWRAMVCAWLTNCVSSKERARIVEIVQDTIDGLEGLSKAAQREARQLSKAKADVTARIEAAAGAIAPPPVDPLPVGHERHKTLFDKLESS